MVWVVGIDEAGYGPNLGPLVMTSVAFRVRKKAARSDLWKALGSAVRRRGEPADDRPLVDDSKFVYAGPKGMAALETGVLATAASVPEPAPASTHDFVRWVSPDAVPHLACEPWYVGAGPLPAAADGTVLGPATARFRDTCASAKVERGPVRSVVVCPTRFNELLDRWGSKAAVLAEGFGELLRANLGLGEPDEEICFVVDKHGGRNHYAPMLQNGVGEGMVVAHGEGARCSRYSVLGLPRPVHITFRPRADSTHFGVALASMVSKYVRELLMADFNRYWGSQVPGIKPTAGYPGDSTRFFEEIRPAVTRLGIAEHTLWRRC